MKLKNFHRGSVIATPKTIKNTKKIVARINRFVGSIASMEHINPTAAVNHLRSKLHGLGVEMVGELPEMADKSGTVSIGLSKFGGVYGKTGEEPAGEVKNDDGIERQLKILITAII